MNSTKEIKVKVCGITDRENLCQLSELGIDFAGFNFLPASPRYVGNDPGHLLSYTLSSQIARTGVFVNCDQSLVVTVSRKYHLGYIQLHGSESEDYCLGLKNEGFKIIRAFTIVPGFDFRNLESYSEVCDLFLFDSRAEGDMRGGRKFNWSLLNYYTLGVPFFLAGGIGPGDAGMIRALDHDMFYGVDLNSRFEERPGFKDIAMLKEFIGELKSQTHGIFS